MELYTDNLFNSEKLFSALYMAECLAHGVVRTNGRGFPPSIIQKEAKEFENGRVDEGDNKGGTAHWLGKCPDLLAMLLYNTKPVHLLSTMAQEMRWMVKQQGGWSTSAQKKTMMKYLCPNVIEEYNMNMNATDIADQLRGNYWPDRWMPQRKWWWSVLFGLLVLHLLTHITFMR
jgi:hypothetical protein